MRRSDLGHQAPQEEDGLGTLAEDSGKGDEADRPETAARLGGLDTLLDFAAQRASVLAHPPAVPREQADRREDDGGRDHVGAEVEQGARQHGDGDAHEDAGQEADPRSDRHVAELVVASEAIERGVHEAEEQRGLEAFARGDEESGVRAADGDVNGRGRARV